MPYIQVEDLDLYYEEFGFGEPILFLHSGFSRGILAFSGQIQPFYSKYHCLYPDFRGHGRTRCESLDWNSSQLCEDMVSFLKKMNIPRVHLIGYSTGGGVAYYMASRYPEMIISLTTIGNGGVIYCEGYESYEPDMLIKNNETHFIETQKVLHAEAHRGNWQHYIMQEVLDWRNHPSLTKEDWSRITMPMLLIAGEEDHYASEDFLLAIKEKCPQAEIMIVPGSGHRPHMPMEHVKEVNQRIFSFLDKAATE